MRTSKYLLSTLKNIPSDTEVISHTLMMRSGMIRKLTSGIYTWLPTGLRVLKKIENIIREEMNKIGAIEIAMSMIQPANLWEKSGRLKKYGIELLKFTDRNQQKFVLGPTHEEVITNLIRNEIHSYKNLPLNIFQIQNKFRDEMRPRFGVMRSREFMMKDAYSFHDSQESLQKTYNDTYQAYKNIFNRMKLNFYVVEADNGSIGGSKSHEFQALSNNGEDCIAFSTKSDYAANIDLVNITENTEEKLKSPTKKIEQIIVPYIDYLFNKLNFSKTKIIKTLLVKGIKNNKSIVALLIRSDHTLNRLKAEKIDIVAKPLTFLSDEEVYNIFSVKPDYLGPIKLDIPIIADFTVSKMHDFICGANSNNKYYIGVNWKRDLPLSHTADLRNVVEGDLSPDDKGTLQIKKSIEIGHIFQLGTEYSKSMDAKVQNKHGHLEYIQMGCYGIGVTRIIAACIEQMHDHKGIIWPLEISPFELAIIPINFHKSDHIKQISEQIYHTLSHKGVDVILDDRKEYLGVMLSDIELIGIPHILVIGNNYIENEIIEYKSRANNQKSFLKKYEIIDFVLNVLEK